MKQASRSILIVILVVLCCAAVFTGLSFVMLRTPAEQSDSENNFVPYVENEDTPKGILFCFDEGGSVFFYFDSDSSSTAVLLLQNGATTADVDTYGYTVFRTVKTDYQMLEGFIDHIGGIELENTRYTGVQVSDMLCHDAQKEIRREIISAIFRHLASNGLSGEELVFIIENSDTDLSFPDGYSLLQSIEELTKNLHFIN
ncbi:MAG: hypothetical protein E7531_04090 [Ruminococcaceae bacterium]|nr:hypothetical protein [Oscillospiraceae bacterium]